MSESVEVVDPPKFLFTTRTNQELGAESVEIDGEGVRFRAVSKKVTENMLSSYPRSLLGKWTPNRAAIRFERDELADRKVSDFETGDTLDFDALAKRAG